MDYDIGDDHWPFLDSEEDLDDGILVIEWASRFERVARITGQDFHLAADPENAFLSEMHFVVEDEARGFFQVGAVVQADARSVATAVRLEQRDLELWMVRFEVRRVQ